MSVHRGARRGAGARTSVFFLLAALSLLAALAGAGGAAAAGDQGPSAGPAGLALVEFAPGTTLLQAQAAVVSAQATLVREITRPWANDGATLYSVSSPDLTSRELARDLRALPSVLRAAPDGAIRGDLTPNDPDRTKQWALTRVWAYSSWELTTGDPSVVVAVLDCGVDLDHPDLAANLWTNPGEVPGNAIDDDHNGYVDDVHGIDALNHDGDPDPETSHGTHVAGILGAVTDNGIGVAGVGWSTKVMALKCLGGPDNVGTNAAAIECVEYVLDQKLEHGVDVVAINTSWGGDAYPEDPFLLEAIQQAADAGIVWCASAGNGGYDIDARAHYPASYDTPAVLAVGASILYSASNPDDAGRATDDLALWSNYGHTTVDLAAPGRDVYSTITGDTYGWMSGTSQAAPQVTGAVALCASEYPDETALERVDRILSGVDPVASLGALVASGGRLNIAAALGKTDDDMKPSTTVAGADAVWHTKAVDISFTAGDGTGIGVDYTEYKLDGGVWTHGAGLTVSADGSHTLQYRSVDKAGRTEDARSTTDPVRVDATAPEATLSGADAAWHTAAVKVTLSAGDATSGLDTLEYRLGASGGWTEVESGAEVTVAAEGETTVQYRAADVAGNSTGTRQATVKVDTVKPTAQVIGVDDAWHTRAVRATLSGSDASSGIDTLEYRPGTSGPWTQVASGSQIEISSDGVHDYQYRARDRAGNVSDTGSFTVKVDRTAPVSTLTGVDASWHPVAVTPGLGAVDATSGVAQVLYRLNRGAWMPAPPATIALQGATTIEYRAVDVAGNEEAVRGASVRIDSAAPSTRALPAKVKRGANARMRYVVDDALPGSGAAVVSRIVVTNSRGRAVATIKANITGPVNSLRTSVWRCKLAKGTYSFTVYANDLAGNVATSRGAAKLVVR